MFRPQAVFPDFGVFSSADVPVSFRFGSHSRVKGAMPKRSAFCQVQTDGSQLSAAYGRAVVHAPQCPKKEGNRVKERAVRCAAVRKGMPMRAARPCPVCLSHRRQRRDERTRSAGALPMKERGKHSAGGITGSSWIGKEKSFVADAVPLRAATDGGKTRSNELRGRFSFRETKLDPPWKSGTIRKQSDRLTLIRLRRGQVGSAAQKPCAPFPASLLPERLLAALFYAAGREMSPPLNVRKVVCLHVPAVIGS